MTTERQFRAILHSAQSRECENRRRAIEARREEARQKNQSAKQVKPMRKNDILFSMTKTAKNVLIMAAAVACGICASLRGAAEFLVRSLMPMPIVARVLSLPVVKERLFYAGREEAVLHYT